MRGWTRSIWIGSSRKACADAMAASAIRCASARAAIHRASACEPPCLAAFGLLWALIPYTCQCTPDGYCSPTQPFFRRDPRVTTSGLTRVIDPLGDPPTATISIVTLVMGVVRTQMGAGMDSICVSEYESHSDYGVPPAVELGRRRVTKVLI